MKSTGSPDTGLDQAKARAHAAAAEAQDADEAIVEMAPFVLMRLSGRWYAAQALQVQKVVVKGSITKVPGLPEYILGITLVHDALIPIVDLAQLTHATGAPGELLTEPRLVILGTVESCVGVIAEEAYGIEHLPKKMDGVPKGVIAGETYWQQRQVSYLDVDKLVAMNLDGQPIDA